MRKGLLPKNLKDILFNPERPTWMLIALGLIGLSLMITQGRDSSKKLELETPPPTLDTYIPAGFVLVTLQLTNSESIDSMIGPYSLVDLYATTINDGTSPQRKESPIATRLRLIRAPNNPSLFGVLVSEDQPNDIRLLADPVFAVIQGPKDPPMKPTKKEIPRRSRNIIYGDLL